MNDAVSTSDLDTIVSYDPTRYDTLTITQIVQTLRGDPLTLLKRGSLAALIARREWGGLMVAACKLLSTAEDRAQFFWSALRLDYSEVRRHMKVWLHWERIEELLREKEQSCLLRRVPFIVPGYRRCLTLIGLTERATSEDEDTSRPVPPPPVERDPLSEDIVALQAMVTELETQNRLEREANAHLQVELALANDEINEFMFNTRRGEQDRHWARRLPFKMLTKLAKLRKRPAEPPHGSSEVRIGDCLALMDQEPENTFDAIVTDPPYAISLHGYAWDNEISFQPGLWQRLMRVLKPGGFVAFFAASRLYHRAAEAAEKAGFTLYPFLGWRFTEGLPKPINVSELFDRDNVADRSVIGSRRGSGFTTANVAHGFQQRSRTTFDMYERHVSDEAKQWKGYFYGVNAMKPSMEPILLVQKPISERRVIDNIRRWGTGALNIGALHDRYGFWPATLLTHRKTSKVDHASDHPSVKPVLLMEDLCSLVCPAGGRILDPFAGTGTTGVAASKQGFECVVMEQNPDMQAVIEERLRRGT